MIIGFTGTQRGMTLKQRQTFVRVLGELIGDRLDPVEFHHGDCIGADAMAHRMFSAIYSYRGCKIVIHPSTISTKRAFMQEDYSSRLLIAGLPLPDLEVKKGYDYLVRNAHIVGACQVLIACPKEMEEEQRSGTWATVRCARKARKQVIIIYPDGGVQK